MPPDRHLIDVPAGERPGFAEVQQLVEAERGLGAQGVLRTWQASDSNRVVLTSDSTGVKISPDNGTTPPEAMVLVPVGGIAAYAGAGAPAGWLACSGQAVSRATYARLFAVISTAYGVGDGSTTFNVPNLTGRVVLGVSGAHPLTQVGGAEVAAGPAHTHPGNHSHGLAGHSHGLSNHNHDQTAHVHGLNSHTHTTDINHGHGGSTGALTGVVQRVVVGTVSDPLHPNDAHGHAVTVNGTGTLNAASQASGTANTATSTGMSTGSPSPSDSQGPSPPDTAIDAAAHAASYGATTVPILPPFLALNYIIRTG